MGRTLALTLALLAGCGRTDLDGGLHALGDPQGEAEPNVPGPNEPGPNQPTPTEPQPEPEPEPTEPEPLPEISIAARVDAGATGGNSTSSLWLFAPFADEPGPVTVSVSNAWTFAFSPEGTRFAFSDDAGLHVVDRWPPNPTLLPTFIPAEFAFLDEARLIVNVADAIELYDLETGTRELLHEIDPGAPSLPAAPLYLVRPSPDGRWVAYVEVTNQIHEIWLLDLDAMPRQAVNVMTLPAGAVTAWLDWAPDSEHLGISATDSDGVWLRSYSVATTESPFEALPISFELEPTASIPTFQWSPTGDALHYYYQRVDLETNESDWRLYLVDMTNAAPGPSVLLSDFAERSWASPGYFSPKGDMVAFSADFAGSTFRAAQFISHVPYPDIPHRQHAGEFSTVLKQEWSPDNQALYFTAMQSDDVERVYRSDLSGSSSLVSLPGADVRGLYVSVKPGCLAYSQYIPTAAVVVVDETAGAHYEIGDPEANNPGWTGNFDSSVAHWVNDRNGAVRGLLYVTSNSTRGDGLIWAPVEGCTPSSPEVVIGSKEGQSIYNVSASTTPPSGERF
jgi:hypothetical protein